MRWHHCLWRRMRRQLRRHREHPSGIGRNETPTETSAGEDRQHSRGAATSRRNVCLLICNSNRFGSADRECVPIPRVSRNLSRRSICPVAPPSKLESAGRSSLSSCREHTVEVDPNWKPESPCLHNSRPASADRKPPASREVTGQYSPHRRLAEILLCQSSSMPQRQSHQQQHRPECTAGLNPI